MIQISDSSGNPLSSLLLTLRANTQTVISLIVHASSNYMLRINPIQTFTFEARHQGSQSWTSLTTGLPLNNGQNLIDVRITSPPYSSDIFQSRLIVSL